MNLQGYEDLRTGKDFTSEATLHKSTAKIAIRVGWNAGVENVHKLAKGFMHQQQGDSVRIDGPVIRNVCVVTQACK